MEGLRSGLLKWPIMVLYPLFFVRLAQWMASEGLPLPQGVSLAKGEAQRECRVFVILMVAGVLGVLASYWLCARSADIAVGLGVGGFITLLAAVLLSGISLCNGWKMLFVSVVLLLAICMGVWGETDPAKA